MVGGGSFGEAEMATATALSEKAAQLILSADGAMQVRVADLSVAAHASSRGTCLQANPGECTLSLLSRSLSARHQALALATLSTTRGAPPVQLRAEPAGEDGACCVG
jgi:hypothetical protein